MSPSAGGLVVFLLSVQDGPQRPSVSVSPSAEMLEGDSVTLTCSADANPAANYTWYKEHEDSPRASGQNFTITDFTAEHSGNYYCEAQNEMGRSNSTLLRITSSGKRGSTWSTTAIIVISVLLLIIIILAVPYIKRRRMSPERTEPRPENDIQIPLDNEENQPGGIEGSEGRGGRGENGDGAVHMYPL
ncbi:cell adhesion molecule CEACAM20-like isoform X4 [Gasterosteus aculeatus]